jgi:hypothetical protein
VLREAVEKEPAFRVYALAALTALDSAAAAVELQTLLNHASMETRYGAVRALSTMDPHDPAIQAEELPGGCLLRVVDSTGEPMIHLTRRKKSEIVVFGAEQRFQPPMVAAAGKDFLIKAEPGRSTVTINHFLSGEETERVEVSSGVADVIRALGKLGARYPDIVQLLVEAERQHNLPGEIGIDALPRAGRTFQRPAAGPESAIRNTKRSLATTVWRRTCSMPATARSTCRPIRFRRTNQRLSSRRNPGRLIRSSDKPPRRPAAVRPSSIARRAPWSPETGKCSNSSNCSASRALPIARHLTSCRALRAWWGRTGAEKATSSTRSSGFSATRAPRACAARRWRT